MTYRLSRSTQGAKREPTHPHEEAIPMAYEPSGRRRTKAQILEDIDRKLPTLPRAEQNLVAAYAHGIRTGLALRGHTGADAAPAPHKESEKP